MRRREFIKRGALWIPTISIFAPRFAGARTVIIGGPVASPQAAGGGGIAFRAAAESVISATASPVVTYPTVVLNDIILTILSTGGHDSSGTPPTGFTKILESDGGGESASVFWKRSDGTETSETWTNIFAAAELGMALTLSYSGCLTSGSPIDVSANETPGSGTAKDIAATTTVANAMCVGIIGMANSTAAAFTVAADMGLTERVVNDTTPDGFVDAGNSQVAVMDIIKVAAGSQNIGLDLGTAVFGCEIFVGLKPQ